MIAGLNLLDKLGVADVSKGDPASGIAPPKRPTATATTFAAALEEAATRTVATLESAEAVSMRALQGEANTREVVDAVMSAEQSLQAAIAIRDKIVTAYLEISRMAI